VAQKYITYVLDVIKMVWYNHVKVGIPETIPQNKIVVLGQYVTKLEKVILFKATSDFSFLIPSKQELLGPFVVFIFKRTHNSN